MADDFGRPVIRSYGAPMMDPRGFAPTGRSPLKTSVITQLAFSGVMALASAGWTWGLGLLSVGFSMLCGHDLDRSECHPAVARALVPGGLATVGAVFWIVGLVWCRARKRGSVGVKVGLVLAWFGSLLAAGTLVGFYLWIGANPLPV